MNVLSAVFNNTVTPAPVSVKTNTAWLGFWDNIFKKKPELLKKFRTKRIGYFLDILYDKNLSEVQKFEKLFDVKAVDLRDITVNGLGNIFDDIGNFFSNENLRKIENGLRQGQQYSNTFANALNVLRNGQNTEETANELTTIRDQQSGLYFGATNFYEKYGPAMLIGGGALLLILMLKK